MKTWKMMMMKKWSLSLCCKNCSIYENCLEYAIIQITIVFFKLHVVILSISLTFYFPFDVLICHHYLNHQLCLGWKYCKAYNSPFGGFRRVRVRKNMDQLKHLLKVQTGWEYRVTQIKNHYFKWLQLLKTTRNLAALRALVPRLWCDSMIRTYKLTHSDIQTHTPIVAPMACCEARGGR